MYMCLLKGGSCQSIQIVARSGRPRSCFFFLRLQFVFWWNVNSKFILAMAIFQNHIASRRSPPRAGYRRGTGEVMHRCWQRSCRGTWEVSRGHFLKPLLLLTNHIYLHGQSWLWNPPNRCSGLNCPWKSPCWFYSLDALENCGNILLPRHIYFTEDFWFHKPTRRKEYCGTCLPTSMILASKEGLSRPTMAAQETCVASVVWRFLAEETWSEN